MYQFGNSAIRQFGNSAIRSCLLPSIFTCCAILLYVAKKFIAVINYYCCYAKNCIAFFVSYLQCKNKALFYTKICNFDYFTTFFRSFLSNLKEIVCFFSSSPLFLSNLKEFQKPILFYATYQPVYPTNYYC
jgi:hypothetical protein